MENYSFHIVDGIILAILGISAVVGFVRGFSREILGIISWLLALFTALYAHQYTYPFWARMIDYPVLAHVATFGSVFVGVLTTTLLVTNRLANMVGDGPLGSLDRTLGLVFGLTRGSIIVCLIYLIIASMGKGKDDVPGWLKDAKSLGWAAEGGRIIVRLLPGPMREPVAETANLEDSPSGTAAAKDSKEKPSLQPQRYVTSGNSDSKDSKDGKDKDATGRTAAPADKPLPASKTAKTGGLDQQGMDALVESVQ
jgi:membrane protein required for colicin V production